MCISQHPKKLFGVALDPADDPWTLQLKQAWMAADTSSLDWLSACLDPYDAVTSSMTDMLEKHHIEPAGKFPVSSWLRPKPNPTDLPYVTVRSMENFFDSGDLLEITKRIQAFVRDKILPEIPVMLGIDHSATAGVVSALSDKHKPENLSVVVLDQHFDAIPLSVRLESIAQSKPDAATGLPFAVPNTPVGFSDQFCCGNFWAYLLDNGIVFPENLVFIGVADYPGREDDPGGNSYRKTYLGYEERGCSFFRRERFDGQYLDTLTGFLREKINTPYVYVSLDLDVGSHAGTYAARYMDRLGISEENILDIARILTDECRQGKFTITGLDIMEFNMHFLGIEMPDGTKDTTLSLVEKFIDALT
jgi:arginase family enzyme